MIHCRARKKNENRSENKIAGQCRAQVRRWMRGARQAAWRCSAARQHTWQPPVTFCARSFCWRSSNTFSYSTLSPSRSALPSLIAVVWQNTSSDPSSGLMKPKPFGFQRSARPVRRAPERGGDRLRLRDEWRGGDRDERRGGERDERRGECDRRAAGERLRLRWEDSADMTWGQVKE